MAHHVEENKTYGVIARFHETDELVAASKAAVAEGYKVMEAYSPIPVHGLNEALGRKKSRLGWMVLCGGILGGCAGFGFQVWVSCIEYPLNVGGRPFFSWPSFIPVTFECTILGAALTTVFGMFGLNGLPQPYHPVFNADGFEAASRDKYFLCIESADPKFDEAEVTAFLQGLNPEDVSSVEV